MTPAPLFSVITPTFNRAYVLWRAIESVLGQSEARFELIVVDDGSTDCTARLLEEFRDERLRSLRTENRGQSAARNRGLSVARAPFIAYLDSDNTWDRTFLEVMAEAIEQDEAAALWHCGSHVTMWERTDDGAWFHLGTDPSGGPMGLAEAWRLQFPDTNCLVHRRDLAEAVGGWDERCRWLEDWDFFLRVLLAQPEGVRWVPHHLVHYRQVHGGGADGVCAEARATGVGEMEGRRYLLEKWGDHPDFVGRDKLIRLPRSRVAGASTLRPRTLPRVRVGRA